MLVKLGFVSKWKMLRNNFKVVVECDCFFELLENLKVNF